MPLVPEHLLVRRRIATSMKDEDRVCLVSYCKCGCGRIIAAAADDPDRPDMNDDFVLEQVKSGFEIRRLGVIETRAAGWGCKNDTQGELKL